MGPRPLGIVGLYTAVHWTTRTRHHMREEFDNTLGFYRALARWNASDPRAWTYLEGHAEPFGDEHAVIPERRVPHENPETRLLRVVVTVQDADKTWPAAYDSFFEVPAKTPRWAFGGRQGVFPLDGEQTPIQALVREALQQAAK